jgi:prolipoprotein diacylglyceryl transferase
VPFGLVGGRLYHLATDWRSYFGEGGAGLDATLRIWDGGLGIWGAVALGGVGAWIGCRRRGIPLPAFGDAVAPGIVLAQAIGRLGNYFNQELYGRETTLPWGMEIFWRQDAAGVKDPHLLDGVSTGELYKVVEPTFLYELLWNVLIFVVLIYVDRRFNMGHGRLFALYIAGYCVGRFGIELLRDDVATHIAGVRVNLFTSTFVFIGAVVYIILAPKGREDPAVLRRTWQKDDTAVQPTVPEPEEELAAVASTSGTAASGAVSGDGDEAEVEDEIEAEPEGTAEGSVAEEAETSEAEKTVADEVPARGRKRDEVSESEPEPVLEQAEAGEAPTEEPQAEAEAEEAEAEEAEAEEAEAEEAVAEEAAVEEAESTAGGEAAAVNDETTGKEPLDEAPAGDTDDEEMRAERAEDVESAEAQDSEAEETAADELPASDSSEKKRRWWRRSRR